VAAAPAAAQTAPLDELSLQDLLNVEVTSVARKEQTIARTAGAIHVITAADIRQSGATTLPEVLRMAPGINVQQLNASQWAVTARGYSGLFANKLLVLIDGRSIYNVLTGGVTWEMQLMPLDTIERIEVIRGPGGSLWGVNAINGVINIITKRADAQQGTRASVRAGTTDPGTYQLGFGGQLGARTYYTGTAQYLQRGTPGVVDGLRRPDAIESLAVAGRLDRTSGINTLSASASVIDSDQVRVDTDLPGRGQLTTAGLRLAWDQAVSSRNQRSLQFSYGGTSETFTAEESLRTHSAAVDLRQRLVLGRRHDLVVGGEYRFQHGRVLGTEHVYLTRPTTSVNLVTAFAQDEIAITPNVAVTPGIKIEHSSDTGAQWQPSIRALWNLSKRRTLWGAASRAVRAPNTYDRFIRIEEPIPTAPGRMPMLLQIGGTPDFRSEIGHVFEAGYRVQRPTFSVDLTAFQADTHRLFGTRSLAPEVEMLGGQPTLIIPIRFINTETPARSIGAEAALSWRPVTWGRLTGSYAHVTIDTDAESQEASSPITGPVPSHQFSAQGSLDLPHGFQLSGALWRISEMALFEVPAYTRLDLRASWTATRALGIAIGAKNLLHGNTLEYRDTVSEQLAVAPTREFYMQLTWGLR
jgi:iron complex outermembrane receptor protein